MQKREDMDQRATRVAQDAPASPLTDAPRNGPLVWWAACSFAAILGFSRLSYGLLLPAVQRDLGGTYGVYGTLATLNFVGYLLGTLCVPLVLAHTRRRLALTTGASLAMSGALLASASSVTLWQLGIWRVLIGVFSAPALVLTMALTLECIAPAKRGKASGLIWTGGAVGILLSGLLAPALLTTGNSAGWRLVWIAMGIGGCMATLGFHVSRRAAMRTHGLLLPVQEEASVVVSRSSLWTMLRSLVQPRGLLFLTLAYGCFGGGYILYLTFFIALLEQQGVPVFSAGFVWAGIGLAGVCSGWLWGRVIDRWPTGLSLAVPLLLGAGGALSILAGNQGWEYAGAALMGFSAFIAPALMVSVLLKRAVADADYAATFSMLTACFALGQILGPLLGSFAIERLGLAGGTASSGFILGAAAVCATTYGVVQRLRLGPDPLAHLPREEVIR
jgi:predicted MFS family arabinose efflux permease